VTAWPGYGKNDFGLDNASIPKCELRQGGPPRDGKPAIDDPRLLPAGEANFLGEDSRVLDVAGNEIRSTLAFWLAWMVFHPQSEVLQLPSQPTGR
jgi:hypothetical protein